MALSGPLLGLPPAWGGTLGFVIAAVSPAVVVPGMLDLGARGYGVAKGVPTMVTAAASFDDVLAIAGFGVCLALAAGGEAIAAAGALGGPAASNATTARVDVSEPTADLTWLVLRAPCELLVGIGFGIAYGTVAAGPASEHAACRGGECRGHHATLGEVAHFRAVLAGAVLAVVGGKRADFSGGGALGALVLGATASRLWPADARKAVQAYVNAAWNHLQPALFGLLGAAVDVRSLDPSVLGSGVGLIASALTLRLLVTRLALIRSGLNAKESGLVCVAWLPKATVQAAVGGAALDLMQERGYGLEAEQRGRLVLMLSVLVILLTAPVGAIGIAILGPRWLSKDETTEGKAGGPDASAAHSLPHKQSADTTPPADEGAQYKNGIAMPAAEEAAAAAPHV